MQGKLSPQAGKYSVIIYCPDTHVTYDRDVMDHKGIGGGATARVRAAYALADRGHQVRLFINCPKERTEFGVETRHFSKLEKDDSDIFIASTSGGQFDLSSLERINFNSRLKILLVHGIAPPNGLSSYLFDFVNSPSNFIREKVVHEWRMPPDKVFVSHRGVVESHYAFRGWRVPKRDPFALLYAGHPSKGLDTAIAILRSLRGIDNRFNLHAYGGAGLWGKAGEDPKPEAGVTYHGIIGQRQLAQEIQRCSFSINLQDRQEPFGMTLIEAMRAGCIPLASPVGAYPEIVVHGQNGFLVAGEHTEESTRQAAVNLILGLVRNPEYIDYLRQNAVKTPLTWDQVASTWEGHWDWCLSGKTPKNIPGLGICNECQGAWLPLADGLHCINCGNYQRKSSSTQ
jgi:glycosyltransferase involved in cell wall biosynthesis